MSAPTASSALAPEHFAALTRLRIFPELLAAAGVHSVNNQQAHEEGFRLSSARDLSGIVFPYPDPVTGHRLTARLRRDHPDLDAAGKPERKYVSPFGDPRHLYILPGAGPLLQDISIPVVIVEAEKSVLALGSLSSRASRKFLPVGAGGCWGWRGKVGTEINAHGERHDVCGPLPDLDLITWAKREVIIALDANANTNPQVRAARRALAEQLEARVASVKIAELPQLPDVNGPDDLIAVSGDDAMLALLDAAQPFAETAVREAEAAIAALSVDKTQNPLPVLGDVAAVADPMRREILKGKITLLKIPGLTKAVVTQAVEAHRQTAQENKAEAVETARRDRLARLSIEPGRLIAGLEKFYADRRQLPEDTAFVESLFCMNTYAYDLFGTTPYLLYDSATGGCGKSTSLERHDLVCARSYLGVDPTPAVLYRKIERDQPTWLLDEARVLQIHGERGQELLALFDAGYKRGAVVSRCEDHGEGIRDFQIYCPKVLARIGTFRGTLLDRGIVIHLEKNKALRQKRTAALAKEAAPLKEELEAYALQYRAQLENLYQDQPDDGYWPQISGREEELWGPLLLHARLAGPEIEKRALEVAQRFSHQKGELAIAADRTLALAQEALEVLQSQSADVFTPREILKALEDKETWGEHLAERKSDKARVTAVGSFFGNFRVASRRHTQSGTEYGRLDVIAALERHLPASSELFEECVAGPSDHPTDTSYPEVSSSQPPENTPVTPTPDTLTPQPPGVELISEEL